MTLTLNDCLTLKPMDWTGFHLVDSDCENENDSPPLAGNSHNADREQTEQTEEEDDNSNDKDETIGIMTTEDKLKWCHEMITASHNEIGMLARENDNLRHIIKERDKEIENKVIETAEGYNTLKARWEKELKWTEYYCGMIKEKNQNDWNIDQRK